MSGIAAALQTAPLRPDFVGRGDTDDDPPIQRVRAARSGDLAPGVRAAIIIIGVLLAGLVAAIVYLYTRNARRLADKMALQHSLELNARLFASQFQQVLANSPSGSGTRASSGDAQAAPAPAPLGAPGVLAFLETMDGTAVSDADDGVVTVEVVDTTSGDVWASSLRPSWAVGPTGRRPGRTLEDAATEDDVRVGELLRAARSKGGGYVEFKYLDSVLNRVRTRTAFAAPVSNTTLVVMAGVSD